MRQILALLMTLALTGPVAAQTLRTEPERLERGAPFELIVEDLWPNACVPDSPEVVSDRGRVVLRARIPEQSDCVAQPTEYRLGAVARVPANLPTDADALVIDFALSQAARAPITRVSALTSIGESRQARAESGLYWVDTDGVFANGGPGTGLSLDIQGERASVNAFFYDLAGNPVWYFGTGDILDDALSLDLHVLRGGQSLIGDWRAPSDTIKLARLTIKFASPSQLTAHYAVRQGDASEQRVLTQTQSMRRFAVDPAPVSARMSGRWLLVVGDQVTALNFAPSGDEWIDETRGVRLRCVATSAEPPPSACVLIDGKERTLASFDQVGLNRMLGSAAGKGDAVAVKLD
jgi:hypothetical protein